MRRTYINLFVFLIISICLIGCSAELSVPENPKVPKYVEDLSVKIDVDRSIDFDQTMYIMACLIRGGVFGGKSK